MVSSVFSLREALLPLPVRRSGSCCERSAAMIVGSNSRSAPARCDSFATSTGSKRFPKLKLRIDSSSRMSDSLRTSTNAIAEIPFTMMRARKGVTLSWRPICAHSASAVCDPSDESTALEGRFFRNRMNGGAVGIGVALAADTVSADCPPPSRKLKTRAEGAWAC